MTDMYCSDLLYTDIVVVEPSIPLVLIIVHLMPTRKQWAKITSLKYQMELMVCVTLVSDNATTSHTQELKIVCQ